VKLAAFSDADQIHRQLAKPIQPEPNRRHAFIEGDEPLELRPVRRIAATSKPTVPGIKGGSGHSGAELEAAILPLVICILACVGIVVAAIVKGLPA
jgi:hypothetical protein